MDRWFLRSVDTIDQLRVVPRDRPIGGRRPRSAPAAWRACQDAALMVSRIAAAVFGVLATLASIGAVARVAWHEEHEVYAVERATIAQLSARSPSESGVRLARVRLRRDQEVTFE